MKGVGIVSWDGELSEVDYGELEAEVDFVAS